MGKTGSGLEGGSRGGNESYVARARENDVLIWQRKMGPSTCRVHTFRASWRSQMNSAEVFLGSELSDQRTTDEIDCYSTSTVLMSSIIATVFMLGC